MPIRMFGDDTPVLRLAFDHQDAISQSPPLGTQRVTVVDGESITEQLVSVSAQSMTPGVYQITLRWEPVTPAIP
jgi:hypothetical protein